VPTVFFAHLQGSRELIADRLDARSHEFMPTGLLASQFAALEPLERDEGGLIVPVEAGLGDQLQAIRAAIAAFRS
jgi:gluconokinase